MQEPMREPEEQYREEKVHPEAEAVRKETPAPEPVRVYPTETARPVAETPVEPGMVTGVIAAIDAVRWGPIFAGLFIAVIAQVFLLLLGLGFGLSSGLIGPTPGGGINPVLPVGFAVWGLITTIISFFVGGYVAGRTSAVAGGLVGMFHGLVVFGLAMVIGMILGGLGAATFIGALGVPGVVSGPAWFGTLTASVWWYFFWLIVGAASAAFGGWLGGLSPVSRTVRR